MPSTSPAANPSPWQPITSAPEKGDVLLWLGETIPDHFDLRVGSYIPGNEAEDLGYREFAKYGGWIIWNSADDWFVIDVSAPLGWVPIPGQRA